MNSVQIKNRFKWVWLAMLCSCFSTLVFGQQSKSEANLQYWTKGRRLTFADFEKTRNTGDTIFIRVNRGNSTHRLGVISTAIDVRVKTGQGRTRFTIRAVMDKNNSWISNAGDTVSLKHEQGHFDICEVYTRIMRRELQKATSLANSNTIYEKVLALESAEHAAFDKENTFEEGGITNAWQFKIARRLKELDRFLDPVVTIAIDK